MTRIAWAAAAVALALGAPAGSAMAQAAPDTQDLQCLAFTFALADSKDENVKNSGVLGAFYFLGKIQAKTPGADLQKPMLDLAGKMTVAELNGLAPRCTSELQERVKAVNALGDQLRKAGQTQTPAAPASPSPPAPAAPPPKK